ncbi:MAG: cohesin domain-containing protein [Gammaproteobacteria bacterium]|nr:cohesin domain-containing protein [Gammaproteobacteria bacterium]
MPTNPVRICSQLFGRWLLLFVGLIGAGTTSAATIMLNPSATSIGVGQAVTVDVNIAGLGAGSAPSLSAFDFELTFDDSVLGWAVISFGDPAGDQLDLTYSGAITSYDDSVAGSLFFSEVSLDDQATLESLQPASFRLAQLSFYGMAAGTTVLDLPSITLLDAIGDVITIDAAFAPISVEVVVPVPAAVWMFGSALGTLMVLRRRFQAVF